MAGTSLVRASGALTILSSGGEGGPNPGRDSGGTGSSAAGSYAEVNFLSVVVLAWAALRSRWFLGWFFLTIAGHSALSVIGVRVDWLTWGGGIAMALVMVGGAQGIRADRDRARVQRHRMAAQQAESARRIERARIVELEQLRAAAANRRQIGETVCEAARRYGNTADVRVTVSDLLPDLDPGAEQPQDLRSWQQVRRDAGYGPDQDDPNPDPLLSLIRAERTRCRDSYNHCHNPQAPGSDYCIEHELAMGPAGRRWSR